MEMISAKPTAASAAATPIEKITNMIPVNVSGGSLKRQNAMKFRFAALSMSSMPMSTMMALRRVSAPARPMAKRNAERMREAESGVMRCSSQFENGGWRIEDSRTPACAAFHLPSSIFYPRFSFLLLVVHGDNHRADHRRRQQQADDFKRQNKFVHQRVADLFDGGLRLRRQFVVSCRTGNDRPGQNTEHNDRNSDARDP